MNQLSINAEIQVLLIEPLYLFPLQQLSWLNLKEFLSAFTNVLNFKPAQRWKPYH